VDGTGLSILIIDDNEENSSLMRDFFTSNNFEITVARDGEKGINAFQECSFDLIMTDLVMPKKNGFEVIQAIRADKTKSETPIIVASASAFATDKRDSLRAGADVFIAKPVDLKDVLKTTCRLLKIDLKELNQSLVDNQPKSQTEALINPETLVLDESDVQNALKIIDLAEIGRLTEIRKILNEAKSPGLVNLGILLEEKLDDLDAEGVIKKVKLCLKNHGH